MVTAALQQARGSTKTTLPDDCISSLLNAVTQLHKRCGAAGCECVWSFEQSLSLRSRFCNHHYSHSLCLCIQQVRLEDR